MKKIIYITAFATILFYTLNSFASVTVDVNFDNGGPIDTAVKATVEADIHAIVDKYADMSDFTRGFGNASTYASHAATLRGYQGYDLFAIAIGSMVSIQAPNDDPKFYEDLPDQLDQGDVYAGAGSNPVVGQAGINLSYIVDGLYMSFKFGKFSFKTKNTEEEINYDSSIIGVLVDYQIFRSKSILARALLWRGITVETGFIHSRANIVYLNELDPIVINSGGYTGTVDPSLDLDMDIVNYTVPIDVYTSVRLLWALNIGVGGGIDYAWGETDLNVKSAGDAVITAPAPAVGKVTIDASTVNIQPDKYRTKLMANVGFSIGPVFIDVPASYYLDNGYAIGLTAGFVW